MRVFAAAALLGVFLGAAPAGATEIGVTELLADPAAFDGTQITLTGELIGDFQRRGDAVWTQLNDDPYVTAPLHDGGSLAGTNVGVGVRFPAGPFDAAELVAPGGYRVRGPVVRATGTWMFHDEERGGESYLSVESFEVVERERPIHEGGNWPVLLIGMALVMAGLVPVVARRRRPAISN